MVCVFGSMFHAYMHVEDSTGYALEHCKKKFWKKKTNFGNGELTNEELTKLEQSTPNSSQLPQTS